MIRNFVFASSLIAIALVSLAAFVFLRDGISEEAVTECRGDLEATGRYSEVGRDYCNCFASELTAELGVVGVLRAATGNPPSVFTFDEAASAAADSICDQKYRY